MNLMHPFARRSAVCAMLFAALTANAQDSPKEAAAKKLQADRERTARRTLIRISIGEAIAAGEAAQADFAELKKSSEKFNATFEDLLTNDAGKRIAKDDAACVAFRKKVYEGGKCPLDEVEARTKSVDAAVASLQADLKNVTDTYVPSAEFRTTIERNRAWANERLAAVTEKNNTLAACLAAAPPLPDAANAPTLRDAIEQLAADEVRQFAEVYDQVVRDTQPEKERLIRETARDAELRKAQAEAEALRQEMDAKLDALRKEHELELARLQRERDELRRELEQLNLQQEKKQAEHERSIEKQKLAEKCNDPKVRQALAPFLAEGYWQPVNAGYSINGQRVSQKAPMSLKVLTAAGALAPGDRGLVTLIKAVGSPKNDRPGWGFRAVNEDYQRTLKRLTPEQIETARQAQQYLIELGPTLVELGQLAE